MKIAYRLSFLLLISLLLFGCGEKTAAVQGKIVDGKGKPVAGVSLIFKQLQPTQGYEQFETKTGADGSFQLKGLAPVSEYKITFLSEKWRTNVTRQIKTLEAGNLLNLTDPIKIRFNQLNNGTVVDTKTGLQWYIYTVSDITAANVLDTVRGIDQAGLTDWRLPTRADLATLQEEKAPPKAPPSEPVFVNKVCCAWVLEPGTEVDWKFYVEEDNELWASNKETPDNRVIVLRDSATPPAASPAPAVAAAAPEAPAEQAKPEETIAEKKPVEAKPVAGVRYASRKACAAKREAAKAQAAVAPAPPAAPPAATPAPQKATPEVTEAAKPAAAPVAKKTEEAKPEALAPKASAAALSESFYFETGSKTLKAREAAKLNSFLSKIKGKKGSLVVEGFSDSTGASEVSNLLISFYRASNVATAAQAASVGKNIKIELRAAGIHRPIASNDTEEGRQKNRRVDVNFIPE
jgi:outer membrane protein OmpA-like peptidoglycan-associated protein